MQLWEAIAAMAQWKLDPPLVAQKNEDEEVSGRQEREKPGEEGRFYWLPSVGDVFYALNFAQPPAKKNLNTEASAFVHSLLKLIKES